MAATAAPYGFVPVNRMSGYEGGSFRQLKMTNSYGTSMFFGDVAELVAAGTIELDTAATSTRPIGIFQGCSFTDPTLNYKVFSQMWTASTSATDFLAHVADDPRQVFQAQSDGTHAQTTLGLNAEIITYAAGNTSIGKSILALDQSGIATPILSRGVRLRSWTVHFLLLETLTPTCLSSGTPKSISTIFVLAHKED